MRIAIIAAMQKEVKLLLPLMKYATDIRYEDVDAVTGNIGQHEVCVSECGIGKVNSALSAKAVIDGFKPDLVINSGVAGGVQGVDICDLFVADGVAYHDVWCGPSTEYGAAFGYPVLLTPYAEGVEKARTHLKDENVHFGLVCSGDKFISTPMEIEEIKAHFPEALAVDMESASIAQTCARYGVPFMIVRAISDTPGSGKNIEQYEDFWNKAPQNTFRALETILAAL